MQLTEGAARAVRPSLDQQRVLDFVRAGTGHAVVRATAGSGKTTTIVQVAASLPLDLRVCFLAFGRDTANELKQRLPAKVHARTIHSLGQRTLIRYLAERGVNLQDVDANKYRRLVRQELGEVKLAFAAPEQELVECEEYLMGLVRFARLNLTDTKEPQAVRELAVQYSLVPPRSIELEDEMHARLRIVLRKGLDLAETEGLIDFTDMLYLPHIRKASPPQYDFVCVDEAQDLSALALHFTLRLVPPAGRLLFVGDPRQSIYGFAGADTDALERIVQRTHATILPLSVTYRCPRSHVALARLVAPEIEASPHASEGRVYWLADAALEKWVRPGDLMLCRLNAPLVATCLRLVRAGKRAYIRGNDLAKQLEDLAQQAFPKGIGDNANATLSTFEEADLEHQRQRLRGRTDAAAILARRRDLLACLRFLLAELPNDARPSLKALSLIVQRTFEKDAAAIVLSTVHRAKGKEAERVFILYPELMAQAYAQTAEALRGEACVQFVALTRAKRDLLFIQEPRQEPESIIERTLQR